MFPVRLTRRVRHKYGPPSTIHIHVRLSYFPLFLYFSSCSSSSFYACPPLNPHRPRKIPPKRLCVNYNSLDCPSRQPQPDNNPILVSWYTRPRRFPAITHRGAAAGEREVVRGAEVLV